MKVHCHSTLNRALKNKIKIGVLNYFVVKLTIQLYDLIFLYSLTNGSVWT